MAFRLDCSSHGSCSVEGVLNRANHVREIPRPPTTDVEGLYAEALAAHPRDLKDVTDLEDALITCIQKRAGDTLENETKDARALRSLIFTAAKGI